MYVFRQYGTKQLRNLRNLVVRVHSLWNGCECLLTVSFSRRSGNR